MDDDDDSVEVEVALLAWEIVPDHVSETHEHGSWDSGGLTVGCKGAASDDQSCGDVVDEHAER